MTVKRVFTTKRRTTYIPAPGVTLGQGVAIWALSVAAALLGIVACLLASGSLR